ncbi:hypothetical protein Q5V23_004424 [Vibrio fluvialis]|nr:hypothetical protein [Vibrio fluvialis]ELL4670530.1 hypothetical protein [Vibrio fluvialis]
MPPLLLKHLHIVVDLLPQLENQNLFDVDAITFEKIITLLNEYSIEYNLLDALPKFMQLITPLFELERVEDGETAANKVKLDRLQQEIKECEDSKRLELLQEISTLKHELKKGGSNVLANKAIEDYTNVTGYSESRVNIEFWIESVRKYYNLTHEKIITLTYAEFIDLSNKQTLQRNVERAYRLKAEAEQNKNKPTPPQQNRF